MLPLDRKDLRQIFIPIWIQFSMLVVVIACLSIVNNLNTHPKDNDQVVIHPKHHHHYLSYCLFGISPKFEHNSFLPSFIWWTLSSETPDSSSFNVFVLHICSSIYVFSFHFLFSSQPASHTQTHFHSLVEVFLIHSQPNFLVLINAQLWSISITCLRVRFCLFWPFDLTWHLDLKLAN